MRKIALLTLLIASVQCNASGINNKFYVGAEGLINMHSTYDVPGASVLGGYRWNEFGVEVGFTKLANDDWGRGLNFKSYNIFADGVYTYSVDNRVEIKGLVGVGQLHTKFYNNGDNVWGAFYPHGGSESAVGVRAGLGVQYKLSDSWTADFTYKIQTNHNNFLGIMNIYSLGLKYYI